MNNTAKNVDFSPTSKLVNGVDTLAKAVASTLGPKGRNVLIQTSFGTPHVTKDGVTVAKSINLEDPVENLAVQIVKQAAAKTVEQAGDGTSSSIVLARAIIKEAQKHLAAGASPTVINKGMETALKHVVSELAKASEQIKGNWDKVKQVATVSANHDEEIGQIIAKALEVAGEFGVVTVKESKTTDTYVETTKGYQFDRGYLSPYFINNSEKHSADLENCLIFVTDKKIRSTEQVVPALEIAAKQGKPLLVIADEVEAQGLGVLVVNKVRAGLQVCAVKAPAFGDRRKQTLEDICILTGANLITESSGRKLTDVTPEDLGSAELVTVTKTHTTIVGAKGNKDAIKERIELIKGELDTVDSRWEEDRIKERLGKMTGGVAVINVGASTEVELKEKKDRLDDALHAAQAAIEEGILPGGGMALFNITFPLTPTHGEGIGMNVLKEALKAPVNQIAINAGKQPGEIVSDLSYYNMDGKNIGYNASTDSFEDLKESGIIDPTKVVRCALENAVSVASMLLSSYVTVTDIKNNQDPYDMDVEPNF